MRKDLKAVKWCIAMLREMSKGQISMAATHRKAQIKGTVKPERERTRSSERVTVPQERERGRRWQQQGRGHRCMNEIWAYLQWDHIPASPGNKQLHNIQFQMIVAK